MTKPRAVVSASLAERGRPEMWANEDEAAVLSGMSPTAFKIWLKSPDALRFPKPDPRNHLRRIPEILAFWKLTKDDPELRAQEELENW